MTRSTWSETTFLRIVISLQIIVGARSFPRTGIHFSDHALGAAELPAQLVLGALQRLLLPGRERLAGAVEIERQH